MKNKLTGIKEVNTKWVKEILVKAYTDDYKDFLDNMGREIIISESYSNYEKLGYVLLALNGSPPKGCAIYQPDHKFLVVIDAWGKTKTFKDIIITDLKS